MSELQRQYPTLKMRGPNTDAMFSSLTQGAVYEWLLELNIKGKKRPVLVLEPQDSKIEAFTAKYKIVWPARNVTPGSDQPGHSLEDRSGAQH